MTFADANNIDTAVSNKIHSYPGKKSGSGVYQNIINTFPKHDIFIDGFYGSGILHKYKSAASINILIDMDREILINHYKIPDAILLNFDTLSYLECSISLFNALLPNVKTLMYLDPPYPISTRRTGRKYYKYEMRDLDHEKLLTLAYNCKFDVVISSYNNEMYNQILSGWNKKAFDTMTRNGKATEYLYYNFLDEVPLHQYNFVGKNFRERAAIKQSINNQLSKINELPAVQRYLLLDCLSNKILSV
jgi:DNA adenine methylase